MMSKLAILCVDDEKSILDSLRIELEASLGDQYLIELAQSGEEALEVILELVSDRYEIALTIVDYIMPGLKGDDLLIRIHEISPKTVKIMLTGQADVTAIGNAINKANLYRYLTKPWQAKDLILTVKEGIYRYCQEQQLEIVNRQQATLIAELHESQNQLQQFLETLESQITERTEALQEVAEAAELANKAKSAFLANMSHELRTPLNAILGFAQLMEREANLTPRQQEYLATINRSGEHLLNLINDVLEMSKIEAGRTVVRPLAFDLHRLLQSLQEMFQIRAEAKKLCLKFQMADDLPRYIITDEGKLRQVLINLLSNAVKFTQKGEIILRVVWGKHEISDNIKLFFEIEDTGQGISPEEIQHLFQPFFQTASGLQAKEGTGLGLAISRQFVQLMGGNIHITSTLSKGSSFRFDVKAKLADISMIMVPSTQRVLQIAPDQPSYRILVVDDQPENCNLIAQLLDSVGFETRTASHGEEAIVTWQIWQPALIWMDMRMPVLDGYEATRSIRQLESELPTHTVIIALTASTFDEQQSRCLAVGCDDFVGKPFREQEIFDKMGQYLGVRYLYAEATIPQKISLTVYPLKGESLTPSDLVIMPLQWRQELHQAATRVNAKLLSQLIQQIPREQQNLADALTELTRQFRFDLIVELTQPQNE